jgi:hypothetical protein
MKEYKDMTREELLRAVELHKSSADTAWRIASALAKEKLLLEKRFLPQFLETNK